MAVAAKGTFPRNTVAIKTGLAAMVAAQPDAIVMVGPYTPLAEFIKEARATGLKAQLGTVSFVGTDNLVAAVGAKGDGVVISQVVPFPEDDSLPVTRECREVVGKHAGEKLGFVNFEGCITAKAMVAALEKAGKTLTQESLIQSLESFKGQDLGGLALTLAPDNHQALNQVFMTQIRDGKIGKLQ
jgi:ABC-type branched-subunit amino acid transport system substrate-binding protein